jgi:nickel-dependent lactate racemase
LRVELAYGKTRLEVDLPDSASVTVVEPCYQAGLTDQFGAVLEALRQPIDAPPLRELVKPAGKAEPTGTVGIVFSDITRPTPNHILVPTLLSELQHVPDDRIFLFNSTGTHRTNTESELRGMLGDAVVDRYRIVQNDAHDAGSHVHVGTTTGGNEIWILKEFADCEVRLLTGFIEPHFFAGFSGGGKALMPGLARLDTVMRNHSARNLDSPAASWGITEGNSLWEEVREAARMAEPSFLLNVTLNRDKEITRVFAGDFEEAHRQGCLFCKDTAMAPVHQHFDVVITSNSGYPLDLNLYQSVKGMSSAAQVVKEGGSIIVAADCWDGIPDHGEYGRLLAEASDPEKALTMVRAPGLQCQDMWQVHVQALICQKADVYIYSHNLSDQQIRDAWLRPCRDIDATVESLVRRYGPETSICVLPEGPQTIPYIANGCERIAC